MSEHEWDPERPPRRAPRGRLGGSERRSREIDEFAALEFPQESVVWVANPDPENRPKRATRQLPLFE